LLAEGDRLASVSELVGISALPDRERMVLLGARLAREAVLQQSALSENDATCSTSKQLALVELVLAVHDATLELADAGVSAATIEALDLSEVVRARDEVGSDDAEGVRTIAKAVQQQLRALS
jgi:V/A-type H+-transporting ATPase subunit A